MLKYIFNNVYKLNIINKYTVHIIIINLRMNNFKHMLAINKQREKKLLKRKNKQTKKTTKTLHKSIHAI